VYVPSTKTSTIHAASDVTIADAATLKRDALLRGLAPHHPPLTWIQVNRKNNAASALEASHGRKSRRRSRRRSRRQPTHLSTTSGNSRENEAQSSSSSGCRRNNQDSGQKIEEPPSPLSPLSPGMPVLFNDNSSENTSAEDDDIRTVRRMTRLRSRQQCITEESQSQECCGEERSARDKKMKLIRMSSSPKDANAQETTMRAEPPPEWSLPALTVAEVMDCPNFSVPGLERLLANAPQV